MNDPVRGHRERVGAAYLWACRIDMDALKPGNVGSHSPGHAMCARDFARSADASVAALTGPHYGLGERIFGAVDATRAAVGCNTNLGIVLLCAPLMHAVSVEGAHCNDLRSALTQVLASTNVVDADWVYRAIRRAAPGGLGRVDSADVHERPRVNLVRAMGLASDRDGVARQYADNYSDIFDYAVPKLVEYRNRWRSVEWAATGVFLDLLGRFPDTHIERKSGKALAAKVTARAAALAAQLRRCRDPRVFARRLLEVDAELKCNGINPGTTADLTVASLLVVRLEEMVGESPVAIATARKRVGHAAGTGVPMSEKALEEENQKWL